MRKVKFLLLKFIAFRLQVFCAGEETQVRGLLVTRHPQAVGQEQDQGVRDHRPRPPATGKCDGVPREREGQAELLCRT